MSGTARGVIGTTLLGILMLDLTPVATAVSAQPPDCRVLHEEPAPGIDAPSGTALFCPRRAGRPTPYYLHLPELGAESAPVLVAVHGISRRAREQVIAFGEHAARLGMVTVAPRFSRERFAGYQRLGHSRRGPRSAPDVALAEILTEVARTTAADVSQVNLFGFSGGAQFAHRYTMRYPQRVRSLALGSAGWYTFPDKEQPFPRGIGGTPSSAALDPLSFLKVPTLVLVGERDSGRDGAFNTAPALDRQQGRSRVERARRWRDAMRLAALHAGITPRFDFELMPDCGHNFGECVRRGDLVNRVLNAFSNSVHKGTVTTSPSCESGFEHHGRESVRSVAFVVPGTRQDLDHHHAATR